MVTYSRGVDDAVFRALADPSRRLLLDRLRERDGRTLVGDVSGLAGESARSAAQDTPLIYSGLKTWLETGRALREAS